MRLIRFLLLLPILLLVSPALILMAIIILIMDTEEGPLRTLFADEVRQFGLSVGLKRFMQRVFIPTYRHNVHSFVLGAAGFLVVIVGLRGLGMLPIELVFTALGVEFTMLILWAITEYFTEEEPITESDDVLIHQNLRKSQPTQPPQVDNDKLIRALNDMSAHLSLLENRLRATETRLEQFGKLDDSLQELSGKLNLIASDQFNLRVKKEFEQLLSELGHRTTSNNSSEHGAP